MEVEGGIVGDGRVRALYSLDHDDGVGERGHGQVAGGKVMAARGCPVGELADEGAARGKDLLRQAEVGSGINDVDACAHDRDGDPAADQRAAMRVSVASERESADDNETG